MQTTYGRFVISYLGRARGTLILTVITRITIRYEVKYVLAPAPRTSPISCDLNSQTSSWSSTSTVPTNTCFRRVEIYRSDTINLNAISKNNRNSVNFFFFFFLRHVSHWKFICTVNFNSIKIQINLRFISRTIREICNRTLLSHFRKRSSLFSKTCKKK